MNSARQRDDRRRPADLLMMALLVTLPLMKPAVHYPVIIADLVFVVLAAVLAVEIAAGKRPLAWQPSFTILAIYVLSLAPSVLVGRDPAQSAFKLTTELYLVGLAAVTAVIVRNEAMLRRVTLTWLAVTGGLAIVCLAGLIAFAADRGGAAYAYTSFDFGTLPPGNYPRLALTFFNANMACNYLTASLGLLLFAWRQQWLGGRLALVVLAGILVSAVSTISPGLGGIALLLGASSWLIWRSAVGLTLGIAMALAFIVALAVTPIIHPTAPFVIGIPGTSAILAPSGRFMTWSAAFIEFVHHPILGHGIGIDAVHVRYMNPSGDLQELTDAHNMFLSLAAQTGIVGLVGLAILIAYAARLTFSSEKKNPSARIILGLTFLNVFVYQGLGGSFEDTRHIWVLLGLLIASARIDFTPADGNSHKAGAPLRC